jgi:hypothetical protein
MPRFYFHLSAPDQDFPDNIGSDVSDLTAAHSIAVRLMKRVMMVSSFADCAPDLRRWTVRVADERQRPVFTVMFPTYFVPKGWYEPSRVRTRQTRPIRPPKERPARAAQHRASGTVEPPLASLSRPTVTHDLTGLGYVDPEAS